MTSRLVVSALVLSLLYGCGPGENELALAKSVRGLETRVEQLTTEGEERAAELARALLAIEPGDLLKAADAEIHPISDVRATDWYRREMVRR